MYMFNRNQAQNSMSEFIQSKIIEEDDQRNEENELEASKENDTSTASAGFETNQNDFMFQMDKGMSYTDLFKQIIK